MSPDKQRIAIAEACPDVSFFKSDGTPYWRHRMENAYDSDGFEHVEFDPFNDLNAMHEAEKVLTGPQISSYSNWLWAQTPCDGPWGDKIWHATATQRAEAFLRALGKWEEGK